MLVDRSPVSLQSARFSSEYLEAQRPIRASSAAWLFVTESNICSRPAFFFGAGEEEAHHVASGAVTSFRRLHIHAPHTPLVTRLRSGFTAETGGADETAFLESADYEGIRAAAQSLLYFLDGWA